MLGAFDFSAKFAYKMWYVCACAMGIPVKNAWTFELEYLRNGWTYGVGSCAKMLSLKRRIRWTVIHEDLSARCTCSTPTRLIKLSRCACNRNFASFFLLEEKGWKRKVEEDKKNVHYCIYEIPYYKNKSKL